MTTTFSVQNINAENSVGYAEISVGFAENSISNEPSYAPKVDSLLMFAHLLNRDIHLNLY